MRILVIEDDDALAQGVADDLRASGYAVDIAGNGIDGEFLGAEGLYDAVVLDLGLPGRPGLEVLRNWRAQGLDLPVLVLTARDRWSDRVTGLKAGADDYLGKPFHIEELTARLDALLRRSTGRASPRLEVAGLSLDEDRQCVRLPSGQDAELTATEYRLLRYFMSHPDKVLSKARLTEHVYEEDQDRDSNVLEVYVRRLREKIGHAHIETRRGQGYVFRGST